MVRTKADSAGRKGKWIDYTPVIVILASKTAVRYRERGERGVDRVHFIDTTLACF